MKLFKGYVHGRYNNMVVGKLQEPTKNIAGDKSVKVAILDEPSPVRFADPCDYDELLAMCSRLWAENGLFEVSETKVRQMLDGHYERKGGIIGVIGDPGHLEGAVSLAMSQMWYSEQWLLQEKFCFVLPEFRRSTNARHLIQFAQKCAVDIGVPLIMGIISNERTEAKVRLYCRQFGGKPTGAYFMSNPVGQGSDACALALNA